MKTFKIKIEDNLMVLIVNTLYEKISERTYKRIDDLYYESEFLDTELPISEKIVDEHFEKYDNSEIKFLSNNSNGKFKFEISECDFLTRRVNIGNIENIPYSVTLKNGLYKFK